MKNDIMFIQEFDMYVQNVEDPRYKTKDRFSRMNKVKDSNFSMEWGNHKTADSFHTKSLDFVMPITWNLMQHGIYNLNRT
jgi:hypothetical protein